jgi:hypothetical protein
VRWRVEEVEAPSKFRLECTAAKSGLLEDLALSFSLEEVAGSRATGKQTTDLELDYRWKCAVGGWGGSRIIDRLLLRPFQVLQFKRAFTNLRQALEVEDE